MNDTGRLLTPFPLSAVEVTDEYCANALAREVDYLLSLDAGRLLAGFYENAGLRTPFVRYGGWESGLIGGHTAGHYLTALSQAAVNPAAPRREELLARVRTMAEGLSACSRALGTGLVWGAPRTAKGGVEAQFDNVEHGRTNIRREAWVPWYTLHKILKGLTDAYELTGCDAALRVASGLGDWVWRRVSGWDSRIRNRVLSVEYGGMNDALYELYSLTGKEEHARAAHAFDEDALFGLIRTEGKDVLKDRHANATIPKFLGALNRYRTLHGKTLGGVRVDAEEYLKAAESFFRIVVERHTYVTGGNSEWEHFGADGVLDAERTNCNCETCNVYNMLKLARGLFCVTGDKRYTDYYDNAFVNSILSSQNPETGMTTYFQPMASGFFKVYSTPFDSFWCCTGTGMENFTKLGEGAYYRKGRQIFVEQYLSSVLRTEDFELEQRADFPLGQTARFSIRRAKEPFFLCLRIPDWAAGITATKNGAKVKLPEGEGHLLLAAAEGDEIALTIAAEVTLKGLPDGKNAFAFRYGGAVLSADLGDEPPEEETTGVDVRIPVRRRPADDRVFFRDLYDLFESPSKYVVREGDGFWLRGGDVPMRLRLHYRRRDSRYAIYLRLCEGERSEEREARKPLDAVQPGYGQYEADAFHEMEERDSLSRTAQGTERYARAGGYFSYDFAVDPTRDNYLSLRLRRKDNGKTLRLTVGGETLVEERLCETLGEETYRREFCIPREWIERYGRQKDGKTALRIRFEGVGAQTPHITEFVYVYGEPAR